MKTRPVGPELFRENGRTDGRTDERTDRYDEAFRSIANALESKRTRICLFNSYAVFSMIHKHGPPLLISCSISHRHLRLNKRGLSPYSTFTSTEYTGFRSVLSRNPVWPVTRENYAVTKTSVSYKKPIPALKKWCFDGNCDLFSKSIKKNMFPSRSSILSEKSQATILDS